MSYLEELLPEFRKGAKIRRKIWDYGCYIDIKNYINLSKPETLAANDWEFYQEPKPDWNYIIKNKCMCFFWDDYEDSVKIGTLKDYNSYNEEYIMNTGNNKAGTAYNYCRPIRRDEVTFYEESKDVAED